MATHPYSNGHLFINLVTAYAQTGSSVIAKHLSDVFTVLGNRVKSSASDPFNEISSRDFFLQVQWALQFGTAWKGNVSASSTALFSDQKVRDVVLKLAQVAEASNYNGVNPIVVFIPAAVCGDKEALKKLAEASKQTGNNSALAKKYLATVNLHGTDDNMDQVVNHIDEAVYDPATVTWTIPATN